MSGGYSRFNLVIFLVLAATSSAKRVIQTPDDLLDGSQPGQVKSKHRRIEGAEDVDPGTAKVSSQGDSALEAKVEEDKAQETQEEADSADDKEADDADETEEEADSALETEEEADDAHETEEEADSAHETEEEADDAVETEEEADEALEAETESDEAHETEEEADSALEAEEEADDALEAETEADEAHETEEEADESHEAETEADESDETEEEADSSVETAVDEDESHEAETEADEAHETEEEADSALETEVEVDEALETETETDEGNETETLGFKCCKGDADMTFAVMKTVEGTFWTNPRQLVHKNLICKQPAGFMKGKKCQNQDYLMYQKQFKVDFGSNLKTLTDQKQMTTACGAKGEKVKMCNDVNGYGEALAMTMMFKKGGKKVNAKSSIADFIGKAKALYDKKVLKGKMIEDPKRKKEQAKKVAAAKKKDAAAAKKKKKSSSLAETEANEADSAVEAEVDEDESLEAETEADEAHETEEEADSALETEVEVDEALETETETDEGNETETLGFKCCKGDADMTFSIMKTVEGTTWTNPKQLVYQNHICKQAAGFMKGKKCQNQDYLLYQKQFKVEFGGAMKTLTDKKQMTTACGAKGEKVKMCNDVNGYGEALAMSMMFKKGGKKVNAKSSIADFISKAKALYDKKVLKGTTIEDPKVKKEKAKKAAAKKKGAKKGKAKGNAPKKPTKTQEAPFSSLEEASSNPSDEVQS